MTQDDPMAKEAVAKEAVEKDALATDALAKDAVAKEALATDALPPQPQVRHPVGLFCDFDGTISQQDLITSIGLKFGGEQAAQTIERVQQRVLSVREGVEGMFAAIPSEQLPAIIDYARGRTVIRDGFHPFVEDVLQRGWLFAVVSGGFDFFVNPVVERFGNRIHVFCNHLDNTGPYLKVQWGVTCDEACDGGCGLCKPTVLRQFRQSCTYQVVIGDGVTDVKAARLADYVAARDRLQKACDDEGIPYTPFESFAGLANRILQGLELEKGSTGEEGRA